MSLTPGHKLVHYEIVEAIGKGGMGEVYRARDTKLGRDVAIKVLPEEFAQDKERLARFRREAKLLASLNHPNIASIHGLEEHQATPFLVMELVDGETLAERITRGPIPLDEAIPLFIQIAEGLELAHEKRIIHRDLKPPNIKIGSDGRPKILDFGLAKAFAADGDAPDASSSLSPTLTRGTALGAILGTAAYMSPEQAKGKTLDRRTDIWAFGCCLYEALTGRSAFHGDDVSETLASVLRDEPAWGRLPSMPTRVRQLLEQCLRKNANRRLQDIGDARIAMEDALETPELPVAVRAPRAGVAAFVLTALGAGLLTALAVLALTRVGPQPVRSLSINLPGGQQLSVSSGYQRPTIAISPDGSTLAYVGRQGATDHLYLRPLERVETMEVPGSDGAAVPFFSPDGQWVGFGARGKLRKVALAGGPIVDICDIGFFRGATWSRDDIIFFASGASQTVMKVPASGGVPEALEANDNQVNWPHVMPGGEALLFEGEVAGSVQHTYVQSIAGGELHLLFENAIRPVYVASGHLLFQRNDALMAVAFDPRRLRALGSPIPVVERLRSKSYAVSSNGTLVYASGDPISEEKRTLVWVDRAGKMQRASEIERRYSRPNVSPDGRHFAVTIYPDVWVLDGERDALVRLTFADGFSRNPIWSPDGRRIYYRANRVQGHQLLSKPSDGSGEAEVLLSGDGPYTPTSISSDGRILIFDQASGIIGMLELDGHHEAKTLLDTDFNHTGGALSPNSRWLAYVSNESGRGEIYVRPFPELVPKSLVSTDGGSHPVWSRDSTELFYRNNGKLLAVAVATSSDFHAGRPELLFERPSRLEPAFDVSADGERFLMVQRDETASTEIRVVLHWTEELKRLAPPEN